MDRDIQEGAVRRYQPYPSYKDSGVEWLGKIPEHWEVHRLKEVAAVQLSNVDKKTLDGQVGIRLCNYTDVYYNDKIGDGLEFMEASATPEQVQKFALRAGDVLITKDSETWTDIAVPAVVAEDLPGVLCGYHLAHIRPKAGFYGPFLARAFSAIGPRDQFHVAAHGITRFGLGSDAITTGTFAVPPRSEQCVIANFLNHETARIDALVAKKQRLIELLQEKRIALITRAVTKGLDQSVPMKDSGVEWLGEIPEHWEVAKTWRLFSAISGGTPAKDEAAYWEGEIPWVSPKDMKRRFIETSEDMITELALAEAGVKLIPNPSILMVVRGMILAHTFPVAITTAPVTVNQDMKALQLRPNVAHSFIAWLFEGIGNALLSVVVEEAAHGTKVIRMDKWHSVELPVPPIDEQHVLAKHLDRETAQIDNLISRVCDAIKRLEELRTALISAAVTGKIDVREEVV